MGMKRKNREPSINPEGVPFQVFEEKQQNQAEEEKQNQTVEEEKQNQTVEEEKQNQTVEEDKQNQTETDTTLAITIVTPASDGDAKEEAKEDAKGDKKKVAKRVAKKDETNGAKQGPYKLSKREKKALEAAPGFNSNYPWFAVPIVKSHKHQLILPFKFVKEYLPKESMNAEIVDSSDKTWNVQYVYKKGRSLLYTGWYSFWSSNELREGDILAFELIEPQPIKLKVSMMKKGF